jgi:hypothetical protein
MKASLPAAWIMLAPAHRRHPRPRPRLRAPSKKATR